MDEPKNSALTRRALLTRAAGVGAAVALTDVALAAPRASAWAGVGLDVGWRFCNRCFGMVRPGWAGDPADRCPASGQHTPQGWTFQLPYNYGPGGSGEDGNDQGNWWKCQLCSVLFWSSPSSYVAGRCPTGYEHDAIDNSDHIGVQYLLPHDIGNPGGTQQWRFCFKCNALFFDGYYPNEGRCPADGYGHAAAGYLFAIPVYSY